MQYKRLFKYDPQCWMPSVEGHVICGHTDFVTSFLYFDARSELMPDLQIVPQEQFENAQRIRNERSVRSTAEAENRLPLNIHTRVTAHSGLPPI